jgi:hypothetical protein
MSYDPRQRPQMPQWGQPPQGVAQGNPWMQQLAARVHAHQQQQGAQPMQPPFGGVGVGPGQPGMGGVPQAMPPGPGMQPPAAATQGQFGANPQLMQALAQRTQAQQAQNQGAPASPPPSQATGRVMGMQGMQPDSDKDGN